MNVFLADKLSASCLEALSSAGHTVVVQPGLKGDALVDALGIEQPQVLVVRSTKVSAAMMDAAPSMELIVRAGAGYDTIDVEAASERGLFVANCPGKNAVAVAELTMGLILALDRFLPDNVLDARAGQWNKDKYARALGLKGRTLGVVGLGNIGQEVVRRAQAFDLRVVGWSRSLTDEQATRLGITRLDSPLDVARQAGIVTLHVASAPDTRGLAGRDFFAAMQPGAWFINTTRSDVVDEAALVQAMDEKGVRAALDVMSDEPPGKEGPFTHPLAVHPNVYMTHHIGASTEQAQEAIAREAVRIVNTYAETGSVPNCVNIARHTPATHQLTVRHLDRVGVLAAVLDVMRKAGWNVQEMENLVFSGARAACARIRFDGPLQDEALRRIQAHPDVLAATLIAL